MARSYKRTPWCGDKKGKSKKRYAWKHVRQWLKDNPNDLPQGNSYKKISETWEICDWGWLYTWKQHWANCQKWHQEAVRRGWGAYLNDLDEREEYRFWYKHYRGK